MAIRMRTPVWLIAALALVAVSLVLVEQAGAATPRGASVPLQATAVDGSSLVLAVPYHAWNRKARYATVILPADYGPGSTEVLPCIVQPHGRKATPLGPAGRWGDLPTTERFMVICPDSSGRRDPANSWAVAGQLKDIVQIVDVVEKSIPWVHIDRERLYLLGISMGGHETLCTLARYPDVFAAGLSCDGNANLGRRYYEFKRVGMGADQVLMRREVGGTPKQVPWLYERRSATPFAGTLASSGVPIAIWWSKDDKIGYNQAKTQTGHLYTMIKNRNPDAPVEQVIGTGAHGSMLAEHPENAIAFLRPGGVWRTVPAAPAAWQYRSWVGEAEVWGYRFSTKANLRKMWRVNVAAGSLSVSCPAQLTVQVPYADDLPSPAVVTVNGVERSLVPDGGYISIRFRAGASTATWSVE